jgi:hypothetical protein
MAAAWTVPVLAPEAEPALVVPDDPEADMR